MPYITKQSLYRWLLFVCCILLFLTSCSDNSSAPTNQTTSDAPDHSGTPRDNTPVVLIPEASGVSVFANDIASIDASNTSDGYIMVLYNGDNEKVQLQIVTPDGTEYTYLITTYGEYAVYPLTGGSGTYTVTVYESVAGQEDMYAICLTQDFEVTIDNEFSPFLHPNTYVNFTPDSEAVKLGESLAAGAYSDLEVIQNIYNYVIENITYDEEKAQNVSYGYAPSVDDTLATKKGICFDYASLMAAMLRSQRIPTKLDVGYAGDVYHAWISCYVDEIGWVNNIIQFDGKSWSLMDPTFDANRSGGRANLVGSGENYQVKYSY